MTDTQLLDELRNVTDSTEDDRVLLSFLSSAKRRVLNRMYPFSNTYGKEIPERYDGIVLLLKK